ncbi:uncharacterized protein [Porites lutea]|uniref:uncharacterized protein isoform X1 n=1 Tax=Porites lutea TaxID=51062 RepID=UPI003CC62B75
MENNPTSLVPRTQRWISQPSINKEFLRSFTGALKVSEMVSLGTGFGSLLHYVKLVDETSSIDILYFVITGVSTFFTLILIVTLVLNLQQKITTSTKNGNLFMLIYPLIAAILLLTSSSLLVHEAVKFGDSYHSQPTNDAKCDTCGKINVAAVFGFLSWILFTLDLFLQMRQHGLFCRKGKQRRIAVRSIQVSPGQEQDTQPRNDGEHPSV